MRGGKAFAEDTWGEVRIGDSEKALIECVKPCTRCKIPTVDLATGIMDDDNQPIKGMKRLRSGRALKFNREDWRLEVRILSTPYGAILNSCRYFLETMPILLEIMQLQYELVIM